MPATRKFSGESFSSCFSCSTQNGTGLGGEGSRVGDQDTVGAPVSTRKFSGLPAHPGSPSAQPRDGICDGQAGWSGRFSPLEPS